ncbi:DMSO/selenate family reductase complex B subunit [Curtanaerobium respiraculi]|uniref:DMSO/selenate family reductase complex B subunit n=1 Tax=Curtanaerobium respiraculi TaxID=2949669 RepID=UPI0024B37453|nr:DMSO/selenate family reductase complex B subunit [Curtanaerobium respiraculi]
MTQYAFYLDTTRCTGCKTCEIACKDFKDLPIDVAYRKVYDFEGGSWQDAGDGAYTTTAFVYHISMSCNHCDSPACVQVCPTGAMHKDAGTGLVFVDETKCIGCGYCHMACPYNAPKVDRAVGHSVKCDGCAERVAGGANPICVDACPLRALEFGTVEEMEKLGARANIAPLPADTFTNPNLYIKATGDARPTDTDEGMIVNQLEVI